MPLSSLLDIDLSVQGPALGLALATGLVLGLGLGYLLFGRAARRRAREIGEREALWEQERRFYEERDRLRQELQNQAADRFAALSAEALRRNNDAFLRLAQERFERLHQHSDDTLRQREAAIDTLLGPIRSALEKTEQQIRDIEKDRRESFGALGQHLQSLTEAQTRLQSETRNLVSALRRPEIRGQWGELTLRRLVELAGMVEHCDFGLQDSVEKDEARLRPDMVVRLPGQREIVVDAKTPLDAYLSAVQASDDAERDRLLDQHARQLGQRIRELGAKQYWASFRQAPEFVVLFIPGDQFLSAALERRPELQEYALQTKVILATPTSLIALLKTVAYGWRQQTIAANAERIQETGEQLHQRIATFLEHLVALGKALGKGVDSYNSALGSLERQVLPAVRRLDEMGLRSKKDLPETQPVVRGVRRAESSSAQDSANPDPAGDTPARDSS